MRTPAKDEVEPLLPGTVPAPAELCVSTETMEPGGMRLGCRRAKRSLNPAVDGRTSERFTRSSSEYGSDACLGWIVDVGKVTAVEKG